jgi:hypothetical protein
MDPLHGHPGQRKTGSGFNHPRVLDGILHSWRELDAFVRRLVRLRIDRRPWMRSTSASPGDALLEKRHGAAMKFDWRAGAPQSGGRPVHFENVGGALGQGS